MKLRHALAVLPLLLVSPVFADELPDLGDVSQATLSLRQEKELGLQIMSEIRADPAYLDDAEIAGYLTTLGNKLILGSREARPEQEFEFFTVQDPPSMPSPYRAASWGLTLALFWQRKVNQSLRA